MYRDDREAADALAEQLKRDNKELAQDKAALERENDRLREELASRPKPAPAATTKKKSKAKPEPQRGVARSKVFNWTIRVVCGLVVGVVSFTITRTLYPYLHPGRTNHWIAVFGAMLNQIWALALISQPILGWWTNDEIDGGVEKLPTKMRIMMLAGGVVAIAVTAAFGAVVGESNPG